MSAPWVRVLLVYMCALSCKMMGPLLGLSGGFALLNEDFCVECLTVEGR